MKHLAIRWFFASTPRVISYTETQCFQPPERYVFQMLSTTALTAKLIPSNTDRPCGFLNSNGLSVLFEIEYPERYSVSVKIHSDVLCLIPITFLFRVLFHNICSSLAKSPKIKERRACSVASELKIVTIATPSRCSCFVHDDRER